MAVEGAKQFSAEARVLVGLSLALFCALGLLAGARMRTVARLHGESDSVQIVVQNIATVAPDVEAAPEKPPEEAPPVVTEDVADLRGAATAAEEAGAWLEAATSWAEVIDHPDAGLDDFLALGAAWEQAGDLVAAKTALNRACVRFPERPDGYAALGALNERTGNLNAARFQYQVGLSYCPGNAALSAGMARCEEALGIEPVEVTVEGEPLFPPAEEPGPPEPQPPAVAQDIAPETLESHIESSEPESIHTPEEQPEPDDEDRVTLIGSGPEVADEEPEGGGEGAEVASDEAAGLDVRPVAEITDLLISATDDQVSIEITTNAPAEFSSRSATQPSRLILRLPHARIAAGAVIAPVVWLNVPLVDRVTIVEGSDDSMVVILIVYLGPNARYTVAADTRSVRVNVSPPPRTEPGGNSNDQGGENT